MAVRILPAVLVLLLIACGSARRSSNGGPQTDVPVAGAMPVAGMGPIMPPPPGPGPTAGMAGAIAADDDGLPADGGVDAGADAAIDAGPKTPRDELLDALGALPAPDFDLGAEVDWWEDFVTTHTGRIRGAPKNLDAAAQLQTELTAIGFEARTLQYPSVFGTVQVVEGIRPGTTEPDRHLGLLAHYDTVTTTVEGAFDNGAGIAVQLTVCKLLAAVATNKTIACLFFDAEEIGAVGSKAYVADRVNGSDPIVFDQAFGHDMLGLNWPGHPTWSLYAQVGLAPSLSDLGASHVDLIEAVVRDFLEPTLGQSTTPGIVVTDEHDREADERSFKETGIPVVRFVAGRRASDYPAYHETTDTVDYVYDFAGDRAAFEAGYEMAVRMSYYTILAFDRYDPAELPAL